MYTYIYAASVGLSSHSHLTSPLLNLRSEVHRYPFESRMLRFDPLVDVADIPFFARPSPAYHPPDSKLVKGPYGKDPLFD